MKRLLLFLSALFLTASAVSAATLSGTVTSVATCGPVSGLKVYANDSFMSWKDSAITNSAGYYSISIPSTVYAGTAGLINVSSSLACGTAAYTSVTYRSGNDVYDNFVVCAGAIPFIGGGVTLGASVDPKAAKVWLIRRDINPTTFDTTLTAVDSAFVTSGPTVFDRPWFQFRMACPNASDVYLLKAALLPSDPNYASYLPSYFDSGLNWNSRTPFLGADFNATVGGFRIHLKPGTNPGGPGFVGGSVLLGANKSTGVGDPLSGRMLILTTAAGQAIGYTYSDAAGKFKFNNVPVGNYKIFGDAGGKWNPALSFSITATKPTVNNIIFEENKSKFEGHLSTTSVASLNALPGVTIFPNPATDYIRVEGLSAIKGIKTIVLRSITGQAMSRQVLEGDCRIDIASLPRGMYTLNIQSEAGNATYSILK